MLVVAFCTFYEYVLVRYILYISWWKNVMSIGLFSFVVKDLWGKLGLGNPMWLGAFSSYHIFVSYSIWCILHNYGNRKLFQSLGTESYLWVVLLASVKSTFKVINADFNQYLIYLPISIWSSYIHPSILCIYPCQYLS